MRPWLALRRGGIAFEEVLHELPETGGKPSFGAFSPNARVPALEWEGVTIAESLSICEWAAEQAPLLWPKDAKARALARAAASIMHSGFPHLRNDAPMNIRRRTDASRITPDGLADAEKVDRLWNDWLARSGGPFLFGQWSIADAMYAPVITRFVTYAIPHSAGAETYMQTMLAEPHFAAWIEAANAETRSLPRSDSA
jgi:glutathione S-transferase